MYPEAVDPTPTLAFSTRTLSPTLNGNGSIYSPIAFKVPLKVFLIVTVTSCVELLYSIFFALMPLELPTAIKVGVVSLRDSEFSKISTINI